MKIETENKIEDDVIILTTKTVEFLLSKHPDSLILYAIGAIRRKL